MVLIGFIGDMRSGKTLIMAMHTYKKYNEGREILSNFYLNFPHEELDINDLDSAIKNSDTHKYENKVLSIDEIHVYLDSRASGVKRSRMISYFITQSGKLKTTIYWTSQFLRQVDVRVRLNTQILYKTTRYGIDNGRLVKLAQDDERTNFIIRIEKYELQDTFKGLQFVKVGGTDVKNPKKYFGLYDTSETVGYREQREVKENGKKE